MSSKALYDEKDLLFRLSQGDEAAFTIIYNQYWNKLYFLAFTHVKVAAVAEEIVQQIFMTIWEKRDQLDIGSLSQYLAAMARYAVYRYLARERRFRQTGLDGLGAATTDEDPAFAWDNRLLLEGLEKLSNELPEKCRMVFIHNKLMDVPLGQVAKDLNISSKTAEGHLTKALKLIRRKFGSSFSTLFFLFFSYFFGE